jgi:hypothetical protein
VDLDILAARDKGKALIEQIDRHIELAKADFDDQLVESFAQCKSDLQSRLQSSETAVKIDEHVAAAQIMFDRFRRMLSDSAQIEAKRQEARALTKKLRDTRHPKLAGAEAWCNNLESAVNKAGQKLDVIETNVAEFRDVVSNQLPAAADLIGEMEQWLKMHDGYENSIAEYVQILQPKFAKMFKEKIARARERFDEKRKEVGI